MNVIGLIVGLVLIGLFVWLMVVNIIGIVKTFKQRKLAKLEKQDKLNDGIDKGGSSNGS